MFKLLFVGEAAVGVKSLYEFNNRSFQSSPGEARERTESQSIEQRADVSTELILIKSS